MTTKNWIGAFSGYEGKKCVHKLYPDGSIELLAKKGKDYTKKSKSIKLSPKFKLLHNSKPHTISKNDFLISTSESEGLRNNATLTILIKGTLKLNLHTSNLENGLNIEIKEISNPENLPWLVEYDLKSGYFMRGSSDEKELQDRLKKKFGKKRAYFTPVEGKKSALYFHVLKPTSEHPFLNEGFTVFSARKIDFLCGYHLEVTTMESKLYVKKDRYLFNGLQFRWDVKKPDKSTASQLQILFK